MNREFLKAILKSLGVEDDKMGDSLDKIMSEHGKAIEAEKGKYTKASEELKAKTAELDAMQKTLTELENSNADSAKVKAELDKLKADIAENEKTAKEKADLEKLYTELDTFTPEKMEYLNDWSKDGIRAEAVKLFRAEPTKGLKAHYESLIKDDKGNYKEGIFTSGIKPGEIPPMGNNHDEQGNQSLIRKAMGLPVENGDK